VSPSVPGLVNPGRCDLGLNHAVNRFESGAAEPIPATLAAIQRALEAAGVEFIPENGGGAGVRLRKPGAIEARDGASLR
jgi:hypothetical protein